MNVELLLNVPLFSGLPPDELKRLAETLRVREVPPGAVLFREGDAGNELFVLASGHMDVAKGMESPEEKILNTIGPGECLGEMSLLMPHGVRSAGARAKDRCRLWVMTRADFDGLLLRQPLLAYNMVKVLSERLAATDAFAFRDLVEKNRQLQRAYDELKAAQAQIIEKERLERELQVAAGIQVSILPHALPEVAGFEFGARIHSARAVGGDFYDVLPLDDARVGVLIGDVAGKGMPSAIFMARAHALITAEALSGGPPGAVLRHVNRYLTRLDQIDLFVTVIYGILDRRSGEFVFARAGHEIPLRAGGDARVDELPHGHGMPIGVAPDFRLDEQSVTLAPGDSLLLYTDGMCDCRNVRGVSFGRDRVRGAFAASIGRPAQAACDALLGSLLDFRGPADQDDDVTLVVVRATG